MLRCNNFALLMLLVGLVNIGLVSTTVQAHGWKSEWYVDPIFGPPSRHSLAVANYSSYNASGVTVDSGCPSCDASGVLVDAYSTPSAMHQGVFNGAAGNCRTANNCPPPTNALLRVWVDDGATVWVNGQETKPQRLAGANRGSRIYSLTGFAPGEIQEAVVEAALVSGGETLKIAKSLTAQAGQRHEVRFMRSEFVAAQTIRRVTSNLLVLYDFKLSNDLRNMVYDVSQQGSPLDLLISDPNSVLWSSDGLQIIAPVLIQSGQTADKIRAAVQGTNEISIEAWVTPANSTTPTSPARIVSLSKNPSERNFTLGQHDDTYEVRLRTTTTNSNGTPSLRSLPGTAPLVQTHVVFTRDRDGITKIYLNGRPFSRGYVGGDFSQWSGQFHLFLANEQTNEQTNNRPWLGTLHLVAIYSRALNDHEVALNHHRGYN